MTEATNETTIFDDTFRTLVTKMPEFTIPLINEIFNTNYPQETPIFHDIETHITMLGRRSTDSNFHVSSGQQYHLECQSSNDGIIVVRMFELAGYLKTKNLYVPYITHILTDAFLMSLAFLV